MFAPIVSYYVALLLRSFMSVFPPPLVSLNLSFIRTQVYGDYYYSYYSQVSRLYTVRGMTSDAHTEISSIDPLHTMLDKMLWSVICHNKFFSSSTV